MDIVLKVSEFSSRCGLEVVYKGKDEINLKSQNINRPSFLLTGYSDYFSKDCVQILGKNEMTYIKTLSKKVLAERLEVFFKFDVPCVIVTRGQDIDTEILNKAEKYNTPIFRSQKSTSNLSFDIISFLKDILSPTTALHAILLDVFGIGVLITGESGIGKSETALELIHRGHRLISDDIVDVQVIDNVIIGHSPPVTENMIELRGLGIIDIKAIFGVGSVLKRKNIQLVIELEKWDDNKVYNRIGNIRYYETILGVDLPKHIIPVMPGRNLAIIIEAAVRDFRLKMSGYNAIDIIDERMR